MGKEAADCYAQAAADYEREKIREEEEEAYEYKETGKLPNAFELFFDNGVA